MFKTFFAPIMAVVLTFLVLGISSLSNISTTIANGVYIDGVDVSGMTQEKAISAVTENANKMINEAVLTLTYEDKTWTIILSDIGAQTDIEGAADTAMNAGKEGSFFEMVAERNIIKSQGLYINSPITPSEKLLEEYLLSIKEDIDIAVTQAVISFDPSEYDFFDKTMDSSIMFDVKEGITGLELDMLEAKSLIYGALINRESYEITLPVKETTPLYSTQELSDMQTLVYHSSSKNTHREDTARSHNMAKALKKIKGLILIPGDTISFFDIIGEPSQENGYLENPGPLIAMESVSREYFGLTQVSTALYNAAFRAGAEIIEVNHHIYPAYKDDYGYGMDACVIYGEKDLVFKNTSDYPMFFDAYLWISPTNGLPGYVDVDVYTVPIGENMYIAPISEILETVSPPPVKYEKVPENQYDHYAWTLDKEAGQYVFDYISPKDGYIVQVYKAIYQSGVQQPPGVWTGGELISKKEYEKVEYPAQQGLIFTFPAQDN